MKKCNISLILSVVALCMLLSLSPMKAYADPFLYMQITGVQGTSWGGEDVYPYYGTANSTPVTLMCISFSADMDIWETWTAEKENIPYTPQFEEAAWLFNDANTAIAQGNTAEQIADQWAAWELFDPSAYNNPAPGTATQMAAAVANYASEPASFYQDFILYAPLPGSQNENGTAQFFLGYQAQTPTTPPAPYSPGPASAPEPASLILLGSGLLGIAGFLFRRRRIAGGSSAHASEAGLLLD